MPELPMLVFQSKIDSVKQKGKSFPPRKIIMPQYDRQLQRLTPLFQTLQQVIDSRNTELLSSLTGVDPEHVIVFEIIGRIEDFANAVSKIPGLEWLCEYDIDEIQPDEDFFSLNKEEEIETKTLSGKLYFLMANSQAINELLRLWELYCREESVQFARGLTKFKALFKQLKNIRRWNIEDRFDESRIFEIWKENISIDPNKPVRFEVELWYRKTEESRLESEAVVMDQITKLNGRILQTCDINEISYHSILAELSANEIEKILSSADVEIVKCDFVMFFRPTGQMLSDGFDLEENNINPDILPNEEFANAAMPIGEPIIAIFDGFPMANHSKLSGRLIIDDPDDFVSNYDVKARVHGTAMCSLIVNGDLNDENNIMSTPLYVRPIMKPHTFNGIEFVPDDFLLVDKIHSAVVRMFEGVGHEDPTAPNVRIINFSICDRDRLFYRTMSPLARLLDWLSYKYNILFVISCGNHSYLIPLELSRSDFDKLSKEEKEVLIFQAIVGDQRNRRLMSPSESINNITVGSIHHDLSTIGDNETRLNPYTNILPAPFTAFGNGFKKSVKPDLVYYGGKQMFNVSHGVNTTLFPSGYLRAPGIKVAFPDETMEKTLFQTGTSCSAALITHNAHTCFETLANLISEHATEIPATKFTLIIKAMLVHGCSWNEVDENIESHVNFQDWRKIKNLKTRLLGYGFPNFEIVKSCTDQRVTVIGFGDLNAEGVHLFKFPLPPSLSAKTIKRRLTITLAWFSNISSDSQKYRIAKLWFETNKALASSRVNVDEHAVKRGTIQHEIFEDDKADAFIDGDCLEIKVICDKDAGKFYTQIPYSIIVSLETSQPLPIYQEVKDRIIIPIQIEQHI